MTAGFANRRSAAQARSAKRVTPAEWEAAIGEAMWLAGRAAFVAEDGDQPGFAERLVRFRARAADIGAESFPVASRVGPMLAAGWLNVARAFAHPEMDPASRTACAPWLEAASLRLDRMLNDRKAAMAAQTWGRGQFGGDQ